MRIDASGEHAVYEQVVLRPRSNGPTVFESFIAIQPLIGKGGVPGEERLLLKGREPSLTPDGEWIVFASPSTAGYRLRRMRLDGTSRADWPRGHGRAYAHCFPGWPIRRLREVPIRSSPPRGQTLQW